MLRSILVICVLLGSALGTTRAFAQQGNEQERRLQRLEEQIVDLSAQVGTVESMARGGGGGGGGGGGDDPQIRAQLNEIMRRLERLEARFGMAPQGGDGGSTYGDARPRGNDRARARPAEQGTGFSIGGLDDQQDDNNANTSATLPPLQPRGSASAGGGYSGQGGGYSAQGGGNYSSGGGDNNSGGNSGGGFSTDTRSNQRGGGGWSTEPTPLPQGGNQGPRADAGGAPVRVAALSSPQAQSAYDQAYGAYQQQNFRAASAGFEQFLQRYPSDPLAGSASFWLGEAAFTSGEYRKAADLYLKTATNYPDNEKAAESMLKLGISLKRLGENDAACSTFGELGKRYPNASALLQRAETEKRRSSC